MCSHNRSSSHLKCSPIFWTHDSFNCTIYNFLILLVIQYILLLKDKWNTFLGGLYTRLWNGIAKTIIFIIVFFFHHGTSSSQWEISPLVESETTGCWELGLVRPWYIFRKCSFHSFWPKLELKYVIFISYIPVLIILLIHIFKINIRTVSRPPFTCWQWRWMYNKLLRRLIICCSSLQASHKSPLKHNIIDRIDKS